MEHSKQSIHELQEDGGANSDSSSKPSKAQAKTDLVVDGKKIQEENEDDTALHQGNRRGLVRFAILAIRFALLAALHHEYLWMVANYRGTGFGLFFTCHEYALIGLIIVLSYMGF
uniref:Uncharacterized protein n=1 Tax=Oryza punctata TaxID=4537 RepID=A0A0E0KQD4_ORYPU